MLIQTQTINSEINSFKNIEYNFNDIYVSSFFFRRNAKYGFHVLFKGSALLLSNCWSHVEIYNLLSHFGLENRIHIISQKILRERKYIIKEIKILKEQIKHEDIEIFQNKVLI